MVAFLGSLLVPLQHMEWIPSYSDNFSKKGGGDGKWHTKIRIVDPYGNFYDQGCGDTIGDMLEMKVNEMGGDEILFTSDAWRHAFDINEPIYTELLDEKKGKWNSERESRVCYRQFVTKIAKILGILTDEVLDGLSAPTYCRALDVFTLKELNGLNGRLIVEDPAPETRHGKLDRMARRQSYQLDRYARVLEYMAGQLNVLMQGAYAPPGYDEEQQDDEE
ncbi:hypothetical protein Tco_1004938 [Tanacetum coccineum]|uniref:Uncharacterized protein n=1 Tax=Tanacetum coccineum TaxID=301880 RepID=A0ABQ5FDG9_9ASTR